VSAPRQVPQHAEAHSLDAVLADDSGPDGRRSDMTGQDLDELRARAAEGDHDAVDQLVELAGERGDLDELRRLADAGSGDAVDVLVELACEREDLDELRRLAAAGSSDAADVLAELIDDQNDGE
jgi:hypothetical protein